MANCIVTGMSTSSATEDKSHCGVRLLNKLADYDNNYTARMIMWLPGEEFGKVINQFHISGDFIFKKTHTNRPAMLTHHRRQVWIISRWEYASINLKKWIIQNVQQSPRLACMQWILTVESATAAQRGYSLSSVGPVRTYTQCTYYCTNTKSNLLSLTSWHSGIHCAPVSTNVKSYKRNVSPTISWQTVLNRRFRNYKRCSSAIKWLYNSAAVHSFGMGCTS